MSATVFGYLLAVSALFLFAGATLVTKAAAQRIGLGLGFLIAATTNVIFATLVLAVQLALRREPLQWNALALWLFAMAGGFTTYLGRWFFFESLVRFGPALASVFQISSPLFTALLGSVSGLARDLVFSNGKAGLLHRLRSSDRQGTLIFTVLGVTTITAQMCTIAAMRHIPVALAALVTLCTLLLLFPLSYWLLKNSEKVTGRTLLGCALTLAGIALIVLR